MRRRNQSDSANEQDDEQCRKARKRATDRKAQRDHRLRQKAYIKQLEESVRELSAQRTQDELVSKLLAEQARLRAECNRLAAKLERVRALVCPEEHQTAIHDLPEPPRPSNSPGATNSMRDEAESDTPAEELATNELTMESTAENEAFQPPSRGGMENQIPASTDIVDNQQAVDFGSLFSVEAGALSLPEHGFSSGEEDLSHPVTIRQHQEKQLESYHHFPPSNAFSVSQEFPPALDDLPSIDINVDGLDFLPYTEEENQSSSHGIPNAILVLPSSDSYRDFGSLFPRYSAPSCYSDSNLLAMVDEARKEHEHGRFNTAEPSLRRLLSDVPADTLSFRLFHYVSKYGAIPLHLLLGIFWTQYLVLRWHVLRTPDALERVPEFLRPTPTECIIPHHFFISVLVWPDIRLELIKQGNNANVDHIGIELLKHLNPYWSSRDVQGALPTMDVLTMIERQSCSLEFWKIDNAFYTKFPQFSRVTAC
ncbi:hypothetical protein FQN50_004270 [Emmonsiellopsis sp. PD_5]|nr:hypothetical protein FQN50_004270 [Emmonsiellopsis sp. PD_5]